MNSDLSLQIKITQVVESHANSSIYHIYNNSIIGRKTKPHLGFVQVFL